MKRLGLLIVSPSFFIKEPLSKNNKFAFTLRNLHILIPYEVGNVTSA